MNAGNMINRGAITSWDRLFYSAKIENDKIVVKQCILNIFQRVLRSVFGVYSCTIFTQKKLEQLGGQFPSEVTKINDLVATLNIYNKKLIPVKRTTKFEDIPNEVKLLILDRLDAVSLGKCQRVCTQLKGLIEGSPILWKNNFAYEHGGYIPAQTPTIGWRGFYMQQDRVTKTLAAHKVPEPMTLGFDREHILGGFSFGNELYFVRHNRSELYCYDITTAKQIAMFNELPAAAFTDPECGPIARLPGSPVLEPIDGTHFLSVGLKQASIWDASKYSCVFAINNVKNGLVHAEGSHVIYYTTDDCLEVWDFTTKMCLAQIKDLSIKDPLIPTAFNTGRYKVIDNLFCMLKGGVVHVYDLAKGEKLYTQTSGNDRPFTKLLATKKHLIAINERTIGIIRAHTQDENQAYVYDPASGSLLHTIRLGGSDNPFQIELSVGIAQNQLIGIPRDSVGTVVCWDLDTGAIAKRFEVPRGSIYSFKVGEPDRLVITTTRPAANNIGVTIWDLNTETLLSETYHQGCSDYFRDGTEVKIHNNIMYFGRWPDDKFHFWDLPTAKPIGTFPSHGDYGHNFVWHFDGARFYVHGKKEIEIEIYNLNQLPPKSLAARAGKAIRSIFNK